MSDMRDALLRYGPRHLSGCKSSTLGPDDRCTCGLSAVLSPSRLTCNCGHDDTDHNENGCMECGGCLDYEEPA